MNVLLYATLRRCFDLKQCFCFVLSPKYFKHKIGVYRGVSRCIKSLKLFQLKVSQSRKQFMVSSILPKNECWDSFMYRKLSQRSFFWDNWGYPKLLLRLSDLYINSKFACQKEFSVVGLAQIFQFKSETAFKLRSISTFSNWKRRNGCYIKLNYCS